jgi:hypothetical protein
MLPSLNGDRCEPPVLMPAQLQLGGMVLDSVTSPHSRRNYAKALDLLFALAASRPLTRALLLEYRIDGKPGTLTFDVPLPCSEGKVRTTRSRRSSTRKANTRSKGCAMLPCSSGSIRRIGGIFSGQSVPSPA